MIYYTFRPVERKGLAVMQIYIPVVKNDFYPSAIEAVGYSDHQRRAGGEFSLFFTGMTYVPGQFNPYIFFWHQAISSHFPRWPPKKLVGTITYEPLVGLCSNLIWLFSWYF